MAVVERDADRAAELAAEYKVLVTDIATAAENAQIVVIAVKPDAVDSVLAELGKVDDNNDVERVTVTLVAGLPAAKYENALPAGSPVVRVMSNMPLLVNEAMSALSAGRYATEEQVAAVSNLLGSVGQVMVVPESLMDAVTAISGSGPAYVFLLAESMIDAGVALGLTRSGGGARPADDSWCGGHAHRVRHDLDGSTRGRDVARRYHGGGDHRVGARGPAFGDVFGDGGRGGEECQAQPSIRS